LLTHKPCVLSILFSLEEKQQQRQNLGTPSFSARITQYSTSSRIKPFLVSYNHSQINEYNVRGCRCSEHIKSLQLHTSNFKPLKHKILKHGRIYRKALGAGSWLSGVMAISY
jgi:hypothetical protein